jgi:hypothetical protein
MLTMPAELLNLIVAFQPLFTKPTWESAKILMQGALLARNRRTVTACLRVVGLSSERHFQNYHRVLNRAKWNAVQCGRVLLGLLVLLIARDDTIVFGADDTVERRKGKKIRALGTYRDAVRSTKKHIVTCFGLKWVSMAMMVRLPWSKRVWALPFLTALCRGQLKGQPRKESRYRNRRPAARKKPMGEKFIATGKTPRQHKSTIDVLMILIRLVNRWIPDRTKVLVVDGGYAAIKLAQTCIDLKNTKLVMRLPWDASLRAFPEPRPAGRRGPAPLKGKPLSSLKAQAADNQTAWDQIEVDWYGGKKKKMLFFSATALWYRPGYDPLPIRYLITRDPEGLLRDEVFACTDLDATPQQIIEWVVMRWSLEVTFEEARAHLGVETQRQWSDLAIARTTPCLFGLFSLVVLFVYRLHPNGDVPIRTSAWYKKTEATFSDCLALVQKHLWNSWLSVKSSQNQDFISFPADDCEHLLYCLSAGP